jgi:hypothetical protein
MHVHVGVWLRLTSWQEEARRLVEEEEHSRRQVRSLWCLCACTHVCVCVCWFENVDVQSVHVVFW